MASIPYDERVQLLQDGRIDFLQFVMNGDHNIDYIEWCKSRNIEPSSDSAERFCELTEIDMEEHQFMNNEDYGIWL